MAHPNKSPEKGFIKELSKPVQKNDAPKASLDWAKPLSGQKPQAQDMKTTYRLSHFTGAKDGTSNFVEETNKHIQTRRAK